MALEADRSHITGPNVLSGYSLRGYTRAEIPIYFIGDMKGYERRGYRENSSITYTQDIMV